MKIFKTKLLVVILLALVFQSCNEQTKEKKDGILVIAEFKNLKDPNLVISSMDDPKKIKTPLNDCKRLSLKR